MIKKSWQILKDSKIDYGAIHSMVNYGHSHFAFATTQDNKHYVIKDEGFILGPFNAVRPIADGFIQMDMQQDRLYVDVLGRISEEITKSGEKMFSYLNGYTALVDLDAEFFLDDLFYKTVLKEEKQLAYNYIKEAYADEARLSLFDVEIIRNTAAIIEAKRENAEHKLFELMQMSAALKRDREIERQDEILVRKMQENEINDVFDTAIDAVMQK